MAGVTLPLCREPGLLIATEPVPTCLRPVVHSPAARFRPDGAGRLGVRPMPPDGHPIVGPLLPGLYAADTHSGITRGPLLGRLVAAEILTGTPDPRLAPYRPDRFPSGGPSPIDA